MVNSLALTDSTDHDHDHDHDHDRITITDHGSRITDHDKTNPDSSSNLSIDVNTGEVSLVADADFESASEYNFEVIATDAAGNISEAQSVTLNIENIDEVAPTITSSNTAAVLQGAGPGAKIYQVTASDDSQDVGDDANIITFGLSGADSTEFEIDALTGAVTLISDPNVDPNRDYNFEVFATDIAGNQSASKSVVLSIIAQDLVAPVITSSEVAAIDENIGAAQVVYTATADDATVATYALAGIDADKFEIDAASGEVTLTANPDYETQSEYSFDIVATDSSGNASDPKTVTLAINNLDEVAPTITSGDVAAAIDENSGVDQVIYTAIADDSSDISGGVTFSLSADSDPALSINALTGEVIIG